MNMDGNALLNDYERTVALIESLRRTHPGEPRLVLLGLETHLRLFMDERNTESADLIRQAIAMVLESLSSDPPRGTNEQGDDLKLSVVSMPATLLNEGHGGWGIFVPFGPSKMQVGWISPAIEGRFYVSVQIFPETQSFTPEFEIGDYGADFSNLYDAMSAVRAFLSSQRVRPLK